MSESKLLTRVFKYAGVTLFFAAAIGLLVWLHYARPWEVELEEPEEVPLNVVVTRVERETLPDAVLLPASVEAYKSVTISAEVPGRVDWLGVEQGEHVEEGTPIAQIDTRTLRAELDQTESDLRLAESAFRRGERLFAENALSEDEYERRRSQMEVAKARFDAATVAFDKGSIAAPSAGILNRRYVELGEYVTVGTPIADIVQVDRVKVVVEVPEREIAHVSVGQPIAILSDVELDDASLAMMGSEFMALAEPLLERGHKIAIGTVTYRSVLGAPATRTYRVEVTLPNPDMALLPGRIVRAVVLRRIIEDTISVPLWALVPREGRTVAFVVEDDRAREMEVELGITDGRRMQVTRGLEEGDMLVVEGQRQLRDFQAVRVRGSSQ